MKYCVIVSRNDLTMICIKNSSCNIRDLNMIIKIKKKINKPRPWPLVITIIVAIICVRFFFFNFQDFDKKNPSFIKTCPKIEGTETC